MCVVLCVCVCVCCVCVCVCVCVQSAYVRSNISAISSFILKVLNTAGKILEVLIRKLCGRRRKRRQEEAARQKSVSKWPQVSKALKLNKLNTGLNTNN